MIATNSAANSSAEVEAATISDAPADEQRAAVKTRALGMWRWKTESSTTPTATPQPRAKMKKPKPAVPALSTCSEKSGPSGTSIPPPMSAGGEADVDRPHHRVDEDVGPALLQLVEGLAEVDAAPVGRGWRWFFGSVSREIMKADSRNVRRVDVEGDAHLVRAQPVEGVDVAEGLAQPGEQGEQAGGDRHRAVGRDQRQRVGGGEVVGRHEVRDRRLLGGGPQQREALEHERRQHQARAPCRRRAA